MSSQRTRAHALLSDEADTFVETIRTLRRLKEVAHPPANSLDKNPLWLSAVARQADLIDESKREVYLATMNEALPFVYAIINGGSSSYTNLDDDSHLEDWSVTDPIDFLPDWLQEEVEPLVAGGRERARANPDIRMLVTDGGKRVRFEFDDSTIRDHFWAAVGEMEKGAATPTHAALLMRSILTMAVSAFEVLVGNLYRSHLMCNPGAADNTEVKSFSLRDLFDFGSVEDAIRESIFQQSDAFSRKGIRAWASWFGGKPLTIDLSELALDWSRTQEVFERRNVVIHNGSRVTRQYLNNVDPALTENLREGSTIDITPDYVDDSLSRLRTLGTLLALHVRFKLFKKDALEETSSWIQVEQFNLLEEGEFPAADQVAKCACSLALVQVDQWLLRVNGWIARMRLNGVETCRKEIEDWDTSALSENFRAAKQVLLRNDEEALRLIKDLLEGDELTLENLTEWPLFHWMREDGVLDDLIKSEANEMSEQTVEFDSAPGTRPETPPVAEADFDV